MNRREYAEINADIMKIYCGILFNFRTFRKGEPAVCSFDFESPVYEQLKAQYPIEKIAGKGSEFDRALRLTRWLAPNLVHRGDFAFSADKRVVPQDALSLLDHSFGKPENGINCVAKALILTACCLALGIYARRVSLLPASPYDEDSHVVTEIFDRKRSKWIMLDPTTAGYVSDGHEPLSVLEMRERFADMAPVSVIFPRQNSKNVEALARRNHEINTYYAKNAFYLMVETGSSPEGSGEGVYLIPEGFDARARLKQNARNFFRMAKEMNGEEEFLAHCISLQAQAEAFDPHLGSVDLWNSPLAKVTQR